MYMVIVQGKPRDNGVSSRSTKTWNQISGHELRTVNRVRHTGICHVLPAMAAYMRGVQESLPP